MPRAQWITSDTRAAVAAVPIWTGEQATLRNGNFRKAVAHAKEFIYATQPRIPRPDQPKISCDRPGPA